MSKESRTPRIGDVIQSPTFAYGWWNEERTHVYVDGETKSKPLINGQDVGAYDESRGTALFVVESVHIMGSAFDKPWRIRARRLDANYRIAAAGEGIQINFRKDEHGPIMNEVRIVGHTDLIATRSRSLDHLEQVCRASLMECAENPTDFDRGMLHQLDLLRYWYAPRS